MYHKENNEINIHKTTASVIGFKPVALSSLIEIVEPTINNVTSKRRFDSDTIKVVM